LRNGLCCREQQKKGNGQLFVHTVRDTEYITQHEGIYFMACYEFLFKILLHYKNINNRNGADSGKHQNVA